MPLLTMRWNSLNPFCFNLLAFGSPMPLWVQQPSLFPWEPPPQCPRASPAGATIELIAFLAQPTSRGAVKSAARNSHAFTFPQVWGCLPSVKQS
jgi:hypothetical protein